MAPKSLLITGGNRGIGLELVKQFILKPEVEILIATCRDKSLAKELQDVAKASGGKVVILELDVTHVASFPAFFDQVSSVIGDSGLHMLFNNAGVLPAFTSLEELKPEDMRFAYEVNCLGPLFLARTLLPLIRKAAAFDAGKPFGVNRAAIVFMSTSVASLAENESGSRTGGYAYRCSKTALNQAMKTLAVDLKGQGILVMSMHPGWVQTDMGSQYAAITTETCCSNMLCTLENLGEEDHGAFKRYDNTVIKW